MVSNHVGGWTGSSVAVSVCQLDAAKLSTTPPLGKLCRSKLLVFLNRPILMMELRL